MNVIVTQDKKFIRIIEASPMELSQAQLYFTKKLDNWFIIKKKSPNWNCEVSFINDYNMIPIGLWKELINMCKKYKFDLNFPDNFSECILDKSVSKDSIKEYLDNLFKDNNEIKPVDHQINSLYQAVRYKNGFLNISTSGGKTLIGYLLFKYLFDNNIIKKMLYVVPNIGLITQTEEKFYLYEDENNIKPNWTSSCVFGGSDHKKHPLPYTTITFGTFQSLAKKSPEYFKEFDIVFCDECHHNVSSSMKGILAKSSNAIFKIGVTGTMPKENSSNLFTLESYIGPIIYNVTSYELINELEFATPVEVIGMELYYLEEDRLKELYKMRLNKDTEDPTAGNKILQYEKNIARENRKRFLYITDLISKTNKNTLVLFGDVQNEYGKKIYNYIKEYTDKSTYYVDGGTDSENREYAKTKMEEDKSGKTVIVASCGTFKEGIDIGNLWNIILIETVKSEIIIAQILGRGMRKYKGKDKVIMIDIRDNYNYGGDKYKNESYLMKHAKEREKIYKSRKFPFKNLKVSLYK